MLLDYNLADIIDARYQLKKVAKKKKKEEKREREEPRYFPRNNRPEVLFPL